MAPKTKVKSKSGQAKPVKAVKKTSAKLLKSPKADSKVAANKIKPKKQKIVKKEAAPSVDNKNLLIGLLSLLLIFCLAILLQKEREVCTVNDPAQPEEILNQKIEENTQSNSTGDTSNASEDESIVIALKNDSFWKISKRACGTGRFFYSIREYNDYQNRSLQPGDPIKVVCSS